MLNKLNKVLQGDVTLEMLQQAKEIYKAIATECFNTQKWTQMNIARKKLVNKFMVFVKENDLTEYSKSIFSQDNGYNVVLSTKTDDGKFEQVLSIKVKSYKVVEDLVENYGFYLV